jgi:uncharacterized RmlC-like cupin family protein
VLVRAATVVPYAEAHDEEGDTGADMDDSDAKGIGAGGPVGPLVEGEGIRVARPGSKDGETPQGVLSVGAVSHETVGAGGIFMARHRGPPGAHSDLHSHTNCETALYVLRGRGYAYGGEDMGEYVEAGPGDFVYIPANLAHVVGCPAGGEALEYVVARDAPGEVVVTLRAAAELQIGPDGRMRDA